QQPERAVQPAEGPGDRLPGGGCVMAKGRSYPGVPAPSGTPTPPSGLMGALMGPYGQMDDPVTSGPGKSMKMQHMGTVVGKRGAGNSSSTGGDQLSHSLHHYGKQNQPAMPGGLKGLVGGS